MFYKSCNRKGTDVKPFLKWAGNKFQIIQRILEVLPSGGRLIEPFVGRGGIIALSPDAHTADGLDDMRYGVMMGRKGFLTPGSCLNAWEVPEAVRFLGKK